jgi:peroxiredoxin
VARRWPARHGSNGDGRLLLSRRPTFAQLSVETRIAIALGVVGVMVFKPDLISSLVTLGAASALGVGVSLVVHGAPGRVRGKLHPGSTIRPRILETILGERVSVPDDTRLIHLQFRRFAGCPVCNLHLRSIVKRHAEIVNDGIREVVVFHSSREELLKHAADLPFAVIADPRKELYAKFGVASATRALLDPRVWLRIVQGVARSAVSILAGRGRAPALNPSGGRFGLPADFLIASDGHVLAVKYGVHAYDQWSVDELLAEVRQATQLAPMLSVGAAAP